ncbi:lysozyme inhibitor LprI family protein [uncultured Ruegeria sp.]|uniref:lysozyme inhibitor LprI family protein n=1 Tax=uncultured Ruegeria sp. TaxID=259304 RepID=UPI0026103805|nr:lysozyme inhibitor LprI family protein [uncultured Ruegeria sp.]
MMRSVILLVLFPVAVFAQQAVVDENYVRGCFSQELAGSNLPECVGDAASTCQSAPGNDTTIGIALCIQAETTVWDALLNEQYNLRRPELTEESAELANQLRDAQRAWINFRDAECGLQYSLRLGGSIRTIIAANCVLAETAERALELRDLGKME